MSALQKEFIHFCENFSTLSNLELIDYLFAKEMTRQFQIESKEAFLFLSYLFARSREGDLCLNLEKLEETKQINTKLLKGIQQLPDRVFETLLVKERSLIYLQRNWAVETKFLHHLSRILHHSKVQLETPIIPKEGCNALQWEAIVRALTYSFSIIIGGPGTGKTFTAKQIALHFVKNWQGEKLPVIHVAAPTGKAATKIGSAIKQELTEPLFFGTLHSLLKVKSSKDLQKDALPLYADLLIIDECSMIDAALFAKLLSAISAHVKVVLLGDPYQLPAVEGGSFFADLIDYAKQSGKIPLTELEQSMRTENLELLELAKAVKNNNSAKIAELFATANSTVNLLPLAQRQELFFEEAKLKLLPAFHKELDFEKLLQDSERFRILSSLRKGPLGADQLNERFYKANQKALPKQGYFTVPILITKTAKELSSGDTGVLIKKIGADSSEDFAVFNIKEDGGDLLKVDAFLLPPYDIAYVLSIHKSQGSEYEEVAILLPPGSENFGKELLYTAITRAKKRATLYCDQIVESLCQRGSRKISGIRERVDLID